MQGILAVVVYRKEVCFVREEEFEKKRARRYASYIPGFHILSMDYLAADRVSRLPHRGRSCSWVRGPCC